MMFSMKLYLLPLFSLLLFSTAAQKIEVTDTLFYNNKWQICEKPIATYYRIGKLTVNEYAYFSGEVKDYYSNGVLQMKGFYDERGWKNGLFTSYYPNGNVETEGSFYNNEMHGVWNYYTVDGKLRAKMNFENSLTFSPLLSINNNGDTVINTNVNERFSIDVSDYKGIIYPSSSDFRLIEGSCINGKREGTWRYYLFIKSIDNNGKLPLKKHLSCEEKYKSGSFKSGRSSGFVGNSLDLRQPYSFLFKLLPDKYSSTENIEYDYAFGTNKKDQTALADFLFNHISPSIISGSASVKNNIVSYAKSVSAGLDLVSSDDSFTPYFIPSFKSPQDDFEGDGYLLYSKSKTIEKDGLLPDSTNAIISFTISRSGEINNIKISGKIENQAANAIRYYLSILKKVKPCNDEKICEASLSLNIYNEIGYLEGKSTVIQQAILKYTDSDSSYRRTVLRDSVFMQQKNAVFLSGREGWNAYLSRSLSNSMRSISQSINWNISKTIIVSFTIDEEGKVIDVYAEKADVPPILIEESIRIIKNSPKWIPAELDGKKIKEVKKQPITWMISNFW